MRKAVALGFWVVLLASPAHGQQFWESAGPMTNPVADTILADTGPVPCPNGPFIPCTYHVQVVVATSVDDAFVMFEWRNPTNTVTRKQQALAVARGQTAVWTTQTMFLVDQERFRVRLLLTIKSTIQSSIFWE